MRYPPRLRRIVSNTSEEWISEDGPGLSEQVPADPVSRAERDYDLVHFDLDPKNSKAAPSSLILTSMVINM